MIKQTFYRKLRKLSIKFLFYRTRHGCIRCGDENNLMCPITALYFDMEQKFVKLDRPNTFYAGEKLGLSQKDIIDIMEGADIINDWGYPSKKAKITHKALLRNLRLK